MLCLLDWQRPNWYKSQNRHRSQNQSKSTGSSYYPKRGFFLFLSKGSNLYRYGSFEPKRLETWLTECSSPSNELMVLKKKEGKTLIRKGDLNKDKNYSVQSYVGIPKETLRRMKIGVDSRRGGRPTC